MTISKQKLEKAREEQGEEPGKQRGEERGKQQGERASHGLYKAQKPCRRGVESA
jgi:hypothetical protein